jgi:ATP-dependent DNA helicase PIF1
MSLLGDGQKRSYASTPFDKASSSKQSKPSPGGGLNEQQQHALELALSGHSIFLTGGAGTGKSFTLKRIIKALQGRYGEESVMITASTGIAACHIGGTTVHSFAGVGLAKEKLSELEAKVKKNRTCSRRWQECRVLIVDEVSTLTLPSPLPLTLSP